MMQALLSKSGRIRFRLIFTIISAGATSSFGQGKPPASTVPEPYRQKFVRYVDGRSITEKALNLIGLTSKDVGRSFALIAGVSKYPNMSPQYRELAAAAADVDELQSYFRTEEFFDEIVVLKDGDVTEDNLKYFLEDYFPDRLKNSPRSRFVFAYSGHGMIEGPKDNPTGYLLKSTARDFSDKFSGINMTILRVYLSEVRDAGYQTLALINACYSGAFLSRRPFGDPPGPKPSGAIYVPRYGGAHAITAGGSNQTSWHDPRLGRGSVFFEKFLAGLGGQADTFPSYPDGHRGDGVITVDEIATYLQEEVSLATNQEQTPIPADLALNRSLGGVFFLNRQKMVDSGIVPKWEPMRATPFGIATEETLLTAKKYWEAKQYDRAAPLLITAAEAGNGEAAFFLGILHSGVVGFPRDDHQAINWFRKGADAGNAFSMTFLGGGYDAGRGGLPRDQAQATFWFRRAADSGESTAMAMLGYRVLFGPDGLPKDEAQAVSWLRQAADAGNSLGMDYLAEAYFFGKGLPKDDAAAATWYRRAADLGLPAAMSSVGVMYDEGLGGLQKDEVLAIDWYRKAADAGNLRGMTALAMAYSSARGGLPHDDLQAVNWYRKAADAGDGLGMAGLALAYLEGAGVGKDDTQGVSWLRKAADAGRPDAMFALG